MSVKETSLESIIDKLRVKSVDIGTSRTKAFSAGEYHMDDTADIIDENKTRCIVLILLIGDGSGSRTVTIEKLEEDGTTYTEKFKNVPIAPADVRPIPPTYDPQKPILVLEGGTNLYLTASAGSPYATIVYWDR